jgi:pSer/pThr/pTyr-binding forkhead associated (FHA) protein
VLGTWLVVEKGAPHKSDTLIKLSEKELILGRSSDQGSSPDIAFGSLFISRKHCRIHYNGTQALLFDLGSRHGTMINENVVLPKTPHILQRGDKIILAKGIVVLRFEQGIQYDETMDFSATQRVALKNIIQPVIVNTEKHECLIYGKRIPLTHKEWCCFNLLYTNVNKLVTFDELKKVVWAERKTDEAFSPDVGTDEINVLLYRLRKKLGTQSNLIKNIRGCGCILELL